MTGQTNGNLKYPDFSYVDFAIGGVEKRNNIVEFHKTRDANGSVASRTVHRFGVDSKSHVKNTGSVTNYEGPSFSDYLPFDFDNRDYLSVAHQMALEFVEYLKTMFEVTPESLLYFFSGNKGFHIYLPIELFGNVNPARNLHAILKRVALLLWSEDKMDTSIYDQNRLFRIPNSKHQTSGLYKVQLRPKEFYNFTVAEIKTLAKQPRKLFRPEIPEANQALVELFSKTRAELKNGANGKFVGRAISVDEIIPVGKRNDILFKLACSERRKGLNEDEIYQFLLIINNARCATPLLGKDIRTIAESAANYEPTYSISNIANLKLQSAEAPAINSDDTLRHEASRTQKKLNAPTIANDLMKQTSFIYTGTRLYHYKDGVFRKDGERFVKQTLQKNLGAKYTKTTADEIVSYIEVANDQDHEELVLHRNLINFKNHVFDWKAGKLKEHSPEYGFITQIPIEAPKGLEVKELNLYVVDKEDWYFCIGANPNELDNSAK